MVVAFLRVTTAACSGSVFGAQISLRTEFATGPQHWPLAATTGLEFALLSGCLTLLCSLISI